MALNISEHEGAVRFPVKVQPRASRSRFRGIAEGALKLQLTAPPVDGAANSALIAFLADALHIAKSRIAIVQGETGRLKLIQVAGVTRPELERRLEQLMS